MKAWMLLAPVLKERSSLVFQGPSLLVRKAIEEAGGIEAYDQKARRKRRKLSAFEEEITRLTQEAKRQQVVGVRGVMSEKIALIQENEIAQKGGAPQDA